MGSQEGPRKCQKDFGHRPVSCSNHPLVVFSFRNSPCCNQSVRVIVVESANGFHVNHGRCPSHCPISSWARPKASETLKPVSINTLACSSRFHRCSTRIFDLAHMVGYAEKVVERPQEY